MKWSILVLTQPTRKHFLARLLDHLGPQVFMKPEVEIVVTTSDPTISLGANRQTMRYEARGEYICFVDDDDLVADDYVKRILPLLDGVDYVGFQLALYTDGRPGLPTYHSLKHGNWWHDAKGIYRDISPVNPIRREIALAAPMSGGRGEDCRWSDAMRATGLVRTEHYIDGIMYHYLYRSMKTDGGPVGPR